MSNNVSIKITAEDHASATLKKAEGSIGGISTSAKSMAVGMAAGAVAALSLSAAIAKIADAAKALIDARVAADQLKQSMTAVFGNQAIASMEFARAAADRLGASVLDISRAYASFSASTNGTAIAGEKTRVIFDAVTNAAGKMGLSAEQSNRAFLALSQIASKGVVSMEELRGQLAEAIPGAMQAAARAMGVTTAELGKMAESGTLMADDLLPKLAAEFTKTFGEGSAVHTAGAEINRLSNAWMDLKTAIGDTGAADTGVSLIKGLTVVLKDATQAMAEARRQGMGGISQIAMGTAGGVMGYDTQEERRLRNKREQRDIQIKINELTAKADRNGGLLPMRDQQTLTGLRQNLAGLDGDLKKMTTRRGTIKLFDKDELREQAAQTTAAIEADLTKKAGVVAAFTSDKTSAAMDKLALSYKTAMEAASGNAAEQNRVLQSYIAKRDEIINGPKVGAGKTAKADRAVIDATVEAYKDYGKAIEDILGIQQKAEIASHNFTAAEQVRAALIQSGAWEKLSTETRAVVDAYVDAANATTLAADAQRAYNAAVADIDKSTASLQERAAALRFEAETMGLTQAAIYELLAARAEEAAYRNSFASDNEERVNALKREAQAYRDLATAQKGRDAKQAGIDANKVAADTAKKAAKDSERAWQKFADDIERSLTDSLYRSFENGENFGNAFVKSLQNTLKTTVLKMAVQAVVSPVMSGVQSMMGGNVGAGGTAGNALSGVSAANNVYSAAQGGGMYGAFATSGIGQAIGLSAAVPMSLAPATSVASMAGTYGAMSVPMTAGGSAAVGATSTALTSLGAALPYIGAALAVISLFSKPGGGPKSGGDAGYTFDKGAWQLAADTGFANHYTPNSANADMQKILLPAIDSLDETIKRFGGNVDSLKQISFGFDTDPQGTAQNRISATVNDRSFINKEVGRDEAALQKGITDEVNRIFIAAFQDADVKGIFGTIADSIDPVTASADEVNAAVARMNQVFADAQTQLGLTAESIGMAFSTSLTEAANAYQAGEMFAGLVTNGIYDALQGQYAQSITSLVMDELVNPIIIALATGGDITALLSDELISTAVGKATAMATAYSTLMNSEEFKTAMDAIKTAGASIGTAAYVAPVPRYVMPEKVTERAVDVISDAEKAIDDEAKRLETSLASLAAEGKQLAAELLGAQGNTQGMKEALAALATEGFTELEISAYQANQKLKDQITTLQLAASWQERLDVLTGTRTDRDISLAKDLASTTDEATQAIIRNVYALEDLREENQKSAEEYGRIREQRLNLETRWMEIFGQTALLRERELASLHESNRARQKQIWLLEDAAAAVERFGDALSRYRTAQDAHKTALDAVDAVRSEATTAYLSAQDAVAAAEKRVTDIQLQAQSDLARAANETAKQFADLAGTLREFVDGASLSPSANFGRLLKSALAGDQDAMRNLPGAARESIDAGAATATTRAEYLRNQARILDGVRQAAELAAQKGAATVADPVTISDLAAAQADLLKAQTEMATAQTVANTIGAALTASVTDLIGQYADAQKAAANTAAEMAAAKTVLEAIRDNTLAMATASLKIVAGTAGVGAAVTAGVTTGFGLMDASLDGSVAYDEFAPMFDGIASDDALKAIFNLIDTNDDQMISQLEANNTSSNSVIAALNAINGSVINSLGANGGMGAVSAALSTMSTDVVNALSEKGAIAKTLDYLDQVPADLVAKWGADGTIKTMLTQAGKAGFIEASAAITDTQIRAAIADIAKISGNQTAIDSVGEAQAVYDAALQNGVKLSKVAELMGINTVDGMKAFYDYISTYLTNSSALPSMTANTTVNTNVTGSTSGTTTSTGTTTAAAPTSPSTGNPITVAPVAAAAPLEWWQEMHNWLEQPGTYAYQPSWAFANSDQLAAWFNGQTTTEANARLDRLLRNYSDLRSAFGTDRQAVMMWGFQNFKDDHRAFAKGGYATPGFAIVGEQGPEIIDFKTPGRVYTAQDTQRMLSGGGNDALIAEVRALRQEVVNLRAEARATANNTYKMQRDIDGVINGQQSLQTVAA